MKPFRAIFCNALLGTIVCIFFLSCAFAKSKPMQIFLIDVEGGQATLIVSPSGQSLLIDTGWPGDRDATRIVEAVRAA
ncbi:MAG: competence protein ComEC, partial [Acidobacteriaceae bacterium]